MRTKARASNAIKYQEDYQKTPLLARHFMINQTFNFLFLYFGLVLGIIVTFVGSGVIVARLGFPPLVVGATPLIAALFALPTLHFFIELVMKSRWVYEKPCYFGMLFVGVKIGGCAAFAGLYALLRCMGNVFVRNKKNFKDRIYSYIDILTINSCFHHRLYKQQLD